MKPEIVRFPLMTEYPSIQLCIHVSNLCSTHGTRDVLQAFDQLLADPSQLMIVARICKSLPLLFRSGQLIEAYGTEVVSKYLTDVYGTQQYNFETLSQKDVVKGS